jgi:hypothetical protein
VIPFALLALIAQVAAAQPPASATTDVDESTTAAEASPLAPSRLPAPPESPAPGARSLDDILSAIPPYEPPVDSRLIPDEKPRAGQVITAPLSPSAGSSAGSGPTYLNDLGSRPDGPPTESDTLYETRILGAFRAAQGSQGPLDGRWLVARAGGGVLYALQFADPGGERIEGAWRDMKATGRAATGFIDTVERDSVDTVVRFKAEASARTSEVRIHPAADGAWVGEALTPAGKIPVVMTRDKSVELAALGVPTYIPPPAPVGRASRHSAKRGKASAKGHASKSKSSGKAKSSGKSKKKKR